VEPVLHLVFLAAASLMPVAVAGQFTQQVLVVLGVRVEVVLVVLGLALLVQQTRAEAGGAVSVIRLQEPQAAPAS
jgi:hypothetical protein